MCNIKKCVIVHVLLHWEQVTLCDKTKKIVWMALKYISTHPVRLGKNVPVSFIWVDGCITVPQGTTLCLNCWLNSIETLSGG